MARLLCQGRAPLPQSQLLLLYTLSGPSNTHPLSQPFLPGSLETFLTENIPPHPLSPHPPFSGNRSFYEGNISPSKEIHIYFHILCTRGASSGVREVLQLSEQYNCLLNSFTLEIPEALKFNMSIIGFIPRWLSGKESACQCRRRKRHEFNPWVRKIL